MSKKPSLGVFSFSACSGCQIAVLNLENVLADLFGKFDIKYFHLIQDAEIDEPVDICIIEGAITSKEQMEKLKQLRSEAKIVVALGSCAVTAGVPAMKNGMSVSDMKKVVFSNQKSGYIKSIKAEPIDAYVTVDYYLRGCPINKEEFASTLINILKNKKPYNKPYPVCTECRLKENGCFLDRGQVCLGSIAYMGCGAPCPTNGVPCDACRGITDDINLKALRVLIKEKGIPEEELDNLLDLFLYHQIKEKR